MNIYFFSNNPGNSQGYSTQTSTHSSHSPAAAETGEQTPWGGEQTPHQRADPWGTESRLPGARHSGDQTPRARYAPRGLPGAESSSPVSSS